MSEKICPENKTKLTLPVDSVIQEEQRQKGQLFATHETFDAGPLPDSDTLAKYDHVLAGFPHLKIW